VCFQVLEEFFEKLDVHLRFPICCAKGASASGGDL
jgi:hypothetical protein